MPQVPSDGQLGLLCVAIALFAIGGLLSLLRLRLDRNSVRIAAKACAYSGITCAIAVLCWHSIDRASWLPLEDNFDALIWLAVLLALFVMYVQRTRPVGGLDWFIMPTVIALLIAAAVLGRAKPHEYLPTIWSWVHRTTAYGGALAFAVAGAVGTMYLIVNHRLRTKQLPAGPNLGSLERLEGLTLEAVSLGFALLTIAAVMGFIELGRGKQTSAAKVVLASCVWLVYAIVLHAPINPRFRGRKVAVLSVVGFVLMIGTLVAAFAMPFGGHS
jgi:ABC-type uncharacterized transport system permease subunit